MKWQQSVWLTVGSFLLAAAFLLYSFPFVQVRENSMNPTLREGDLVLLNRLAYVFSEVRPGDVLVFGKPGLQPAEAAAGITQGSAKQDSGKPKAERKLRRWPARRAISQVWARSNSAPDLADSAKAETPAQTRLEMIKRCVLESGAQLQWWGSRLYIPYLQKYVKVTDDVHRDLRQWQRIPQGYIFVLGDNRAHSLDSRSYGLVALSQIRGKALWLALRGS